MLQKSHDMLFAVFLLIQKTMLTSNLGKPTAEDSTDKAIPQTPAKSAGRPSWKYPAYSGRKLGSCLARAVAGVNSRLRTQESQKFRRRESIPRIPNQAVNKHSTLATARAKQTAPAWWACHKWLVVSLLTEDLMHDLQRSSRMMIIEWTFFVFLSDSSAPAVESPCESPTATGGFGSKRNRCLTYFHGLFRPEKSRLKWWTPNLKAGLLQKTPRSGKTLVASARCFAAFARRCFADSSFACASAAFFFVASLIFAALDFLKSMVGLALHPHSVSEQRMYWGWFLMLPMRLKSPRRQAFCFC